jgi:hypothetical protein
MQYKCRHLKKLTCKGALRQVYYLSEAPLPSYEPILYPPPPHDGKARDQIAQIFQQIRNDENRDRTTGSVKKYRHTIKKLCAEYPHSFTSQLKGQTVVEHDRAEFHIDVEAEDADVTWYRDGKKIIPEQVGIRGSSQNRWASEEPS